MQGLRAVQVLQKSSLLQDKGLTSLFIDVLLQLTGQAWRMCDSNRHSAPDLEAAG